MLRQCDVLNVVEVGATNTQQDTCDQDCSIVRKACADKKTTVCIDAVTLSGVATDSSGTKRGGGVLTFGSSLETILVRRRWTIVEIPDGRLQVIQQPSTDRHVQQPKHQPGSKMFRLRLFADPATKVSDARSWWSSGRKQWQPWRGGSCQEGSSNPICRDRDCEQLLDRARTHLEAIECTRASVVAGIEDGTKRLESLKASSKISRRQFQTRCQSCTGCRHWWPRCSPNLYTPTTWDSPSSKRARLREDCVPFCVEEMQQWVWDRPQDLQGASRPEEVGKIAQLINPRRQEWHRVRAEYVAFHGGSNGRDLEAPDCRYKSWRFVRGGTRCTGTREFVSGRRRIWDPGRRSLRRLRSGRSLVVPVEISSEPATQEVLVEARRESCL